MDDLLAAFRLIPTGPFDSPAEERFLHYLVKVLASDASYDDHVPVNTLCGAFVVDYVVRVDDRRVGFEIDGRDFHDAERDAWRDAAILAAGAADTMIHIPASALYLYPYDSLYLISRAERTLFSERGLSILERLAHRTVRRVGVASDDEHLRAFIWRQEDEVEPDDLEESLDEDDEKYHGMNTRERAELRNETRVWNRILTDEVRYGQQSPYCLNISRRQAGGPLLSLIAYVRRFGPASIDEIRASVAQLSI